MSAGEPCGANNSATIVASSDSSDSATGPNVAAIPSQDAVIVRLGWTPEGQAFDWNKYLSQIAAALAPAAPAP